MAEQKIIGSYGPITSVRRMLWLTMLGSLLPFAVLFVMTLAKTGGVFEYALDDVYIHLAMSEQIARGGYGVNAGEYASASSSILYSYLLVPFAGSEWHQWWPLVLGFGALLGASVLWARVLGIASETAGEVMRMMLFALALLGPAFLHFHAMALIGMEHMLHIVVVLLVLNGLLDFAKSGRIGWMLVVGVVLNPLLRFEGMSIALLACAVLYFSQRRGAALVLLGVTLLPLAAHFWHMSALGLDMLPNSVNAKAAVLGGGADEITGAKANSRLQTLWYSWLLAYTSPSGRMLMVAAAAFGLGLVALRDQLHQAWRLIGWAAVLAGLGQLLFGLVSPFFRYEVYVWTFMVGASAVLVSRCRFGGPMRHGMVAAMFLLWVLYGGVHYPIAAFGELPGGGAAIHAQQRQMGNFVDRHWQAPIAVNDLGHVAFRNPFYVLDLWGLASREALEARLRGDDPLWADRLAVEKGVRAAMVYDHWLRDHIPANWVPVAKLKLTIPRATLGGNIVTIYATTPEAVAILVARLKDFAPELPATAELIFLESSPAEG